LPPLVPTHQWRLPGPVADSAAILAQELGVPSLAAELLWRRGYRTAAQAKEFLDPAPARLRKPDSLPDIGRATGRIVAAIRAQERMLVYGDYDVDGVAGTVLLVSALKKAGADAVYYLPHREAEGYGLSSLGVEFGRKQGCRLLITNDCGSSDHATVAEAAAAGIDVIVTDHHELRTPQPDTPPLAALAVVNPKRPDSLYPFRELAGAGVAFKLAWSVLAALGRPKEELIALLDLAALGTIADVVPLVDENRVLARLGLNAIRRSPRPGVQALLRTAGIADRPLTGHSIGFMLGPRINAAGRVGHARQAAQLLLTDDAEEAAKLATELEALNRSRQSIEERIAREAASQVELTGQADKRTIVVAGEDWHEGVIGIVASRLSDRFYRPCVVVALKGERAKGSGRSITGFDLHAALRTCSGHLLGFGGHRYAAGITLDRNRLAGFAEALETYAQQTPEDIYERALHVDVVASIEQLDEEFVSAMDRFEPFGPDNEPPVYASLGVEVVGYPRRVGKNHLKMSVRSGRKTMDAVAWGRSADIVNLEVGVKNHIDICYTLDRRTYQGRTSLQLTLRDIRTATR
jgi:single-stranded-DNA-specific exonuclease